MSIDPDLLQRLQDYGATFGSDPGQRVLDDLRKSFMKRSSFVPDSDETAFREGQRDVVLRIERLLDKSNKPDLDEEDAAEILT